MADEKRTAHSETCERVTAHAVARLKEIASVHNLIEPGLGIEDMAQIRVTGVAGFEAEEP